MSRAGIIPLKVPRCRRCQAPAGARTPGGLRCMRHAVEEYAADLEQGVPDWIPKLLPNTRHQEADRP